MENTNQNPQVNNDLQLIKTKSDAEFALTPIGQQVKQFEMQQRMARMYSESDIVPDTYKGKMGNCVIAIDMAQRMGANPLMIMQNLAVIKGNPSFSAKFLIACVNASGRYYSLRYEWKGKPGTNEWGCRCYTYEKDDIKKEYRIEGSWIDIQMAKDEGWYDKNQSKWKSMPQQMLIYRAAAFWQRAYCPEISMGFISTEEAEDLVEDVPFEEVITNAEKDVNEAANASSIGFEPQNEEKPKQQQEQPAGPGF